MSQAAFDLDQGASTGAMRGSGSTAKEMQMLPETIIASILSVAFFGGFAALLGWAVWYTRKAG